MEINYFDLVASVIILLLGLKGIINGFFKEVFGLIGIVGGLFIASRVGKDVGTFLNDLIFSFTSPSAINFLGFLTTLALFWLLMILIGFIFKKLSSISGLGPLDKILGFVFGASKFFLIAAVIAHATYSIQAVKSILEPSMKTSIIFPIMVESGAFIMKIDPVNISADINATIENGKKQIQEKTEKMIQKSTDSKIDEIKKELAKQIEEQTKER